MYPFLANSSFLPFFLSLSLLASVYSPTDGSFQKRKKRKIIPMTSSRSFTLTFLLLTNYSVCTDNFCFFFLFFAFTLRLFRLYTFWILKFENANFWNGISFVWVRKSFCSTNKLLDADMVFWFFFRKKTICRILFTWKKYYTLL